MSIEDAMSEFMKKLERIPDAIEAARATVTIAAVDKYAVEFKNGVEAHTPEDSGGLKRSIKLMRIKKNGTSYGWRLVFDGYTKEQKVAFQIIANTLNSGRKAGISDSGRPISSMEALKFIDEQLAILRRINPEIEKNMKIGGWAIDDEEITLSDGTKIKAVDFETTMRGVQ